MTDVTVDVIDGDIIRKDADNLHLMYGGFEIEYVFSPMNPFHVSVYSLFGIGNVSYRNIIQESHDNSNYNHDMGNSFFVAEPAVNLELNVTPFSHLALGA